MTEHCDVQAGKDHHGRFRHLLPFTWELLWFTAGALAMHISFGLTQVIIGALLFGGLIASWAYQRGVSQEGAA